jgi:hypothetical protein
MKSSRKLASLKTPISIKPMPMILETPMHIIRLLGAIGVSKLIL